MVLRRLKTAYLPFLLAAMGVCNAHLGASLGGSSSTSGGGGTTFSGTPSGSSDPAAPPSPITLNQAMSQHDVDVVLQMAKDTNSAQPGIDLAARTVKLTNDDQQRLQALVANIGTGSAYDRFSTERGISPTITYDAAIVKPSSVPLRAHLRCVAAGPCDVRDRRYRARRVIWLGARFRSLRRDHFFAIRPPTSQVPDRGDRIKCSDAESRGGLRAGLDRECGSDLSVRRAREGQPG